MTTATASADFLTKLRSFLGMIRFSHSVFALPFALIAMLVAAGGMPGAWTLFFIVLAVVAARTAAMCFNRIADREIDARNPRTANRELVTGEISMTFAWGALFVSVVLFYLSAAALNFTALMLSTPVLIVLLGYSLTKRVTNWSHLVLGAALGLAPLGAWVAVTGGIGLFPILLGLGVTAWVAGFDILYSCQDYEVDSATAGLHSLPKKLGIAGAMRVSEQLHIAAFLLFVIAAILGVGLGVLFFLGVLAAGGLLWYQHRIVSPDDLSRINAAFFTANGVLSILLFLLAWIDV